MIERNMFVKMWKDISGQTAGEEQEVARQHLFKQQQLALLERTKVFWDQFAAAVDIPKIIPDKDLDYGKEVRDLDEKVKARALYAKVPGGRITFHGQSYTSDPSAWKTVGDLRAHAEAFSANTPHLYPLTIFRNSVVSAQTYSGIDRNIREKHFIAAVNVPDTEDSILSYMFNQGYSDRTGAYCPTVSVNFLMDKASTSRVLGLIRLNPDFAETFLQTTAAGFEGGTGYPGINRIRSDEIIIVNLANFNRSRFSPFSNEGGRIHEMASGNVVMSQGANIVKDMFENANDQIERYKYSHPYGKIQI